jgi:hypothetical protein
MHAKKNPRIIDSKNGEVRNLVFEDFASTAFFGRISTPGRCAPPSCLFFSLTHEQGIIPIINTWKGVVG